MLKFELKALMLAFVSFRPGRPSCLQPCAFHEPRGTSKNPRKINITPKGERLTCARSVLNLAKSHMQRGDCRRYERGQLALAAAFRVLAASCFFRALPCANSSIGVISAFNAFAFNSSSHAGIVSAPLPRIF